MNNEGFEFVVVRDSAPADGVSARTTAKQLAAEAGYGIVESIRTALDRTASENPNTTYANSLSPSEKAAYFLTLNGPGGCVEQAAEAVPSEPFPQAVDLGSEEVLDLVERVRSSPGAVEAEKEWARCMSDSGYEVRQLGELDAYALRLIVEQVPNFGGLVSVGEDGLSGEDPVALTDGELEAASRVELDLAAVDFECRDRTIVPASVDALYEIGGELDVEAQVVDSVVRIEFGGEFVRER